MICLQKGQRTVTSLSAWGKQASEGEKTKVANDVKAQYDSTAPTYNMIYILYLKVTIGYVLYLKITIAWSGLVPCQLCCAVARVPFLQFITTSAEQCG